MENPFSTVVNRRLRELGRTQNWLAEQVDVTDQAVSKWLKTGQIKLDHAKRVAELLSVSLDSLLRRKPSPADALFQVLLSLPESDRKEALGFLLFKIDQAHDVLTNDHARTYRAMIESIMKDMAERNGRQ